MGKNCHRVIVASAYFAFAFLLTPQSHAQETGVEISHLSGTVDVLLSDAEEYAPAEEGMILEAADSIRSGSTGEAELSFNTEGSNIIRLSENTELKILLEQSQKAELSKGELFASISQLPSGSSFEIRTPTAVSGARNTDWVTRVTDEGTEVEAIEHTPYVRHFDTSGSLSSEDTPLSQGQMTVVRKFERPRPPMPMQERRVEKWKGVKQDVRRHAAANIANRQNRPRFDRQQFKQRVHEMKQKGPGPGRPGQEMRPFKERRPMINADNAERIRQQKPGPGGFRKKPEMRRNTGGADGFRN
jgi:hypothetical protein